MPFNVTSLVWRCHQLDLLPLWLLSVLFAVSFFPAFFLSWSWFCLIYYCWKVQYFCIILINTCVFIIHSLWFLILTPKAHRSGLRTVVFGSVLVVSWILNFAFSSFSWLLQPWPAFIHQKRNQLDHYFVTLTLKLAMTWARAWTNDIQRFLSLNNSVINCISDFNIFRRKMQLI